MLCNFVCPPVYSIHGFIVTDSSLLQFVDVKPTTDSFDGAVGESSIETPEVQVRFLQFVK